MHSRQISQYSFVPIGVLDIDRTGLHLAFQTGGHRPKIKSRMPQAKKTLSRGYFPVRKKYIHGTELTRR
jgi:hypothetical protein